jgi:low affinity Fe/Cu permease
VTIERWFARVSASVADAAGQPVTFLLAVAGVVLWAAMGPRYHYSDTYQLVINTATTIITFLMVFLIQNTQNRDSAALHLKLDELIKAIHGARNELRGTERLPASEIERLKEQA